MKPFSPPLTTDALLERRFVHTTLAATRIWRSARDNGTPPQPRLFAGLEPWGLGLLAPAFDSVLRLAEIALGRRFGVGVLGRPSPDERWLLTAASAPAVAYPAWPDVRTEDLRRPLAAGFASLRWLYRTAVD